jgi:hypothetical protein
MRAATAGWQSRGARRADPSSCPEMMTGRLRGLRARINFARRSFRASARPTGGEHGCGAGSRLRQRPASLHPAKTAHLLPTSWHDVPTARAIQLASLPRHRDKPAGERWEEARLIAANAFQCSQNSPTRAQPDFRRFQSRLRRALRAVLGQTEHETGHGLFSGSEAHSRQIPQLLCVLTSC